MNTNNLIIFLSLFLFSCSSHLSNAKEIYPNDIFCGSTSGQFIKSDKNFISTKDKDFKNIISKIKANYTSKNYNLIVVSSAKPSGGFALKLKSVIEKNDIFYFHFNEIEPPKNTIVSMAQTYSYCLLKIENLDKFKIIIK